MSIHQLTNYIELFGNILLDSGFSIVPIRPKGKRPSIKSWTEVEATPELISQWSTAPGQGVGIKTGFITGLDVDIDDPHTVNKFIDYCQMLHGDCPVRGGRGDRVMMVFRAMEPAGKRTSGKYLAPWALDDEEPEKLEILGDGQQFVAYGVHPTGIEYQWRGGSLHEWDYFDIPSLTPDDITHLVEVFESMVGDAGYARVGSGKESSLTDADLMESIKPPLDISDGHVSLVLAALPADDYDDWVQAGMALHHQFGGDETGLRLWDVWSQQSEKYSHDIVEAKWRSFSEVRGGSVVTFASLIQKAGVKLTGDDPLAEALQNFVYIADGDKVADMRKMPTGAVVKLGEFKNYHCNIKIDVADVDKRSGKPIVKKTPLGNVWLSNIMRRSVDKLGFLPGGEQIYEDNGVSYYNMFSFPRHEDTGKTDKTRPFIDHVAYLFPVVGEREWFLDWIAHVLQNPRERSQVTPLHISALHGTGRGLLVRTLQELVGLWNCAKTTIRDLTEGNYTEFLHNTLFAFIDETRETGKGQFEVSDKIRDKLTENVLQLNVKYGFKGPSRVFTRLFMASNHSDALRIPVEDRRMNVFDGPSRLREQEYYNNYAAWVNDPEAIAQVFWMLKKRDITLWDMQRSMDTEARARMIDYSRNETEHRFFELLDSPPYGAMTYEEVCDALDNWEGSNPMDEGVNHGQVLRLLKDNCRSCGQIKIDGVRCRPWLLSRSVKCSKKEVRILMKR